MLNESLDVASMESDNRVIERDYVNMPPAFPDQDPDTGGRPDGKRPLER